MSGRITDIQRFCVSDGPGIRTSVFFKGCPLSCLWCHNPETRRFEKQLMWYAGRCTGCGNCRKACPAGLDPPLEPREKSEACLRCGTCAEACSFGALEIKGKDVLAEALMAEIAKDRTFFEMSGGGVTFTGGEPLAQPEFLLELLNRCSGEGIHTAVETCGYAPQAVFQAVCQKAALLLIDMKHPDTAVHRRYTGVDNGLILQNLAYAIASGCRVWLRIPFIPGVNHSPACAEQIADILRRKDAVERIEILPYHTMGQSKSEALLEEYRGKDIPAPTDEMLKAFSDVLKDRGFFVRVLR